jgi:hypothetical protein
LEGERRGDRDKGREQQDQNHGRERGKDAPPSIDHPMHANLLPHEKTETVLAVWETLYNGCPNL